MVAVCCSLQRQICAALKVYQTGSYSFEWSHEIFRVLYNSEIKKDFNQLYSLNSKKWYESMENPVLK